MKTQNEIHAPGHRAETARANKGRLCALALAICSALLVSGCLRKELRDAKVSGEIMTDTKGRRWLVVHNLGDTFFLQRVNADGTVNTP